MKKLLGVSLTTLLIILLGYAAKVWGAIIIYILAGLIAVLAFIGFVCFYFMLNGASMVEYGMEFKVLEDNFKNHEPGGEK